MTATQLRMAIAATGVSLRSLAEETGLHASQISRIQKGRAEATTATMRKIELYFTGQGLVFTQRNGSVIVASPEFDLVLE